MVDLGRRGRKDSAGFYDYHADGSKTLWPELSQFVVEDRDVSIEDAVDRLIYRQVIETLRCLDEGVLNTETEANIGSIFAIGFPPHTGGALQFIHGKTKDVFLARAAELAEKYGERFVVPEGAIAKMFDAEQKAA